MAKSKAKKATDDELVSWVRDHDVDLWMRRVRMGRAIEECRSRIGSVSKKRFVDAVGRHCTHFKRLQALKPSKETGLSEYGWESFNSKVAGMLEELRGKDIDYVVMVLRANGLPANRTLVRGSSILGSIVKDFHSDKYSNPSWLSWDG